MYRYAELEAGAPIRPYTRPLEQALPHGQGWTPAYDSGPDWLTTLPPLSAYTWLLIAVMGAGYDWQPLTALHRCDDPHRAYMCGGVGRCSIGHGGGIIPDVRRYFGQWCPRDPRCPAMGAPGAAPPQDQLTLLDVVRSDIPASDPAGQWYDDVLRPALAARAARGGSLIGWWGAVRLVGDQSAGT